MDKFGTPRIAARIRKNDRFEHHHLGIFDNIGG
jgi:hypothetical protein